MLQITPTLQIDESELLFEYVRSSGPGGQNVNKVATAVQLRFDLISSSLPGEIKQRLTILAGKKLTDDGILIIQAKRFRTQEQNRGEALRRFIELVRRSTIKPKPRKRTAQTKSSIEKRLKEKKKRGELKKSRQNPSYE